MDKLKSVEKEICECVCLFVTIYLAVSMVKVDQYKVTVKIIVVDFSGGAKIYDKIRMELSGLEIGILINNVGVAYEHPDYFLNIPDDRLWQLINVNMASVVMVCVYVRVYVCVLYVCVVCTCVCTCVHIQLCVCRNLLHIMLLSSR